MDWLIGYGVKEMISTGTCGVLVPIAENRFLVPVKALRDEGTSYHYVAPSCYIDIDPKMLRPIEKTLSAQRLAYRQEEGCSVVEMECSALAAVAQLRGILWGQLLFTADTLADVEVYDQRNRGADSFSFALHLCLEVFNTLEKDGKATDF